MIWRNVVGLVLMHLGAILAFAFFSWSGALLAAVLSVLTCQFGITLGYHRLLAHRSYKAPRWFVRVLGLLGTLACQSGPLSWVAAHRCHHKYSDEMLDPHSPGKGLFWAHIGWTVVAYAEADSAEAVAKLCPDLAGDAGLEFLQRHFIGMNLAFAALIWASGWLAGGAWLGTSLLLWGFCLRVVVIWHVTFLVNSAAHAWGYQTYDTRDRSRNNWLVALLTYGEGWHNNHHADQRSAAHGHRWWEIDTTYLIIRALGLIGLATDIIQPSEQRLLRLRLRGTSPGSP